ncbi:hypothetical protein ACFQLX_14960 [Streptomyces polyrhachis]|uniref:Aromatic ring-opening dioxygenase LigA n=1 Tax=Streptomyces polyrhachis TaxID=1282885 RepID=A0ABW2GHN5_9ACTN
MTQTPLAPTPPATRPTPPRRWLRAGAVAACVPYLSLKFAWIAGSRVGIPDGSPLLDNRALMAVGNSVTVLMDSAVIVLALLLTQDWGRRAPAWLLALPMWAATGLLVPIMTGFPVQLVVKLFAGSEPVEPGGEPFLDDWVFGVVYSGFIVQGLTLGTLFVLYAKDRWGHLWQGRIRDLPRPATGTGARTAAIAGSALTLLPITTHLTWAFGSTSGLPPKRIVERTPDFYALEALTSLTALAAAAGVLLLVFRIAPALPLKAPLAPAWAGSGAVGCWGAWMTLAALLPADDPEQGATGLMLLTYSVSMIAGFLLFGAVASFLRRCAS